jgi:hypothetical protein
MRHVFGSHREVAHVWANDWRDTGHGSGKNVFFDGPTIYSYGRHFPIASFVTARDGSEVVLFTTRRYSVSTAKHISIVSRALPPGFRVYYTSDPSSRDWRSMMRDALDVAAKAKLAAGRRRSDWRREGDLNEMASALASARFFAYQAKVKLPASDEAAVAEAERFAAAEEKRLRRVRTEQAKAEAQRKALLETLWDSAKPYWRTGENYPEALIEQARTLGVYLYSFHNASGLSIALRQRGDEIETSWGARFPVEHGLRAFRLLKQIWARHGSWERQGVGPRLGHYVIDAVTPEGVRAGCHFVSREEVELMASTVVSHEAAA